MYIIPLFDHLLVSNHLSRTQFSSYMFISHNSEHAENDIITEEYEEY